ncbi:hypothetical protein HRS9122_04784 [Pyrenophora teres f. teres]|nr:hypothetical protein HRS9122_04784 [Pyrenophora teres f. teres]KAE8861129.1 hypothetical protein PTNB29_06224 [Pyrenophora teres f. teres]
MRFLLLLWICIIHVVHGHDDKQKTSTLTVVPAVGQVACKKISSINSLKATTANQNPYVDSTAKARKISDIYQESDLSTCVGDCSRNMITDKNKIMNLSLTGQPKDIAYHQCNTGIIGCTDECTKSYKTKMDAGWPPNDSKNRPVLYSGSFGICLLACTRDSTADRSKVMEANNLTSSDFQTTGTVGLCYNRFSVCTEGCMTAYNDVMRDFDSKYGDGISLKG